MLSSGDRKRGRAGEGDEDRLRTFAIIGGTPGGSSVEIQLNLPDHFGVACCR